MNDQQRKKWETLRDRFVTKRLMMDRMIEGNWHEDAAHFAKEMAQIRAEMQALVAEALPIDEVYPRFVADDFDGSEPYMAGHPRNGY
jgi:hypothetical protein